jgi:tetratricopeptide (TPR) repeat protein
VLAATTILPYEGAREGHDLYRQAHLLQAARLLRHQKPDDALDHIAAARLWPEHLGVGKPFAIDERPEDYLQALCLQADGRIDPALELYRQIARSTGSIQTAADYLAVRSLRLLGREQEAADKLQQSLLHSEMAAETRAWLLALESEPPAAGRLLPKNAHRRGTPHRRPSQPCCKPCSLNGQQ